MRSYGAMQCDPPPVPERHLVTRLWCHLGGSAQFDQLVLPPCPRSFDWSISIWYCTANLMGHHFGNAESASILRTCPSQRSCVFFPLREIAARFRGQGVLVAILCIWTSPGHQTLVSPRYFCCVYLFTIAQIRAATRCPAEQQKNTSLRMRTSSDLASHVTFLCYRLYESRERP